MAGTSTWFWPDRLSCHKSLLPLCLLVLARLTARASGDCTSQPTLTTDGGVFNFSIDVKLDALPGGVPLGQSANVASILQSSNGAFHLLVKGSVDGTGGGGVSFYIDTTSGGDGGAVAETTSALVEGQWHTLVVLKDHDQVCLQLDSDANVCSQRTVGTAAEFHMAAVGDLSWGNASGLALRNLVQTPTGHAEYTTASAGSYIQYYLIGVKNMRNDPSVDWFADTTDTSLGNYVKPKYGSFTRFRMECGYEQEGTLGYFELQGSWTWPAYGVLAADTTASVYESNVASDPTMPGHEPYPDGWLWSNGVRGANAAFPTFGGGLWTSVDGVTPAKFSEAFACKPEDTAGAGLETWATSSHAVDRQFIRLWVGEQVSGTVTTTTTATCTTTETRTATTSTATTSTQTSSTVSSSTATTETTTVSSTSTISTTYTGSTTRPPTLTQTSTSTSTSTQTSTVTSTTSPTSTTSITTSTDTATTTGSTTTSTTPTPGSTLTLTTTATATSTASTATSATSTATSVTATTPTSTTTTTLTAPSSFSDVASLMSWITNHEGQMVANFWADPDANPVTLRIPGATLAVFKVSSANPASTMSVPGTSASVEVPASVLGTIGVQEAACVVSIFDDDTVDAIAGESLAGPPIVGAMNVNIFDSNQRKRSVDDLDEAEPIVLTMPVNRSEDRGCSYYDETDQQWSTKGMTEVEPQDATVDGPLQCKATHLTFFGAILKGFLNTFLCAQVRLLNPESIKQLLKGDWWYQPIAILFWFVVLSLNSLLVAACVLDHKRRKKGVWGDEFFLIPLEKDAERAEKRRLQESGLDMDDQVDGDEEAPKTIQGRVVECILCPFQWCKRSSACRDALDDVVNGWFEYFGELRSFCEAVCEGVRLSEDADERTTRSAQILQAVSGSLILGSARRRTSASLGMSEENVAFIMQDPDLGELLLEAALTLPIDRDRELTRWETRLAAWLDLHKVVLQHFDAHWHATGWGGVPCASSQLFYSANPFVSVFLGCRFWSSSLRVLLFSSELSGAMMMCTVFFTTMFPVPGKGAVDESCLGPRTIGERLGRILAIAVGSGLVAGLPIGLLSSLHHRSFKKVDYEGCPEWNRQLKIWRLQDKALWTLSLLYTFFCGFFVCLFLANTDQRALPSWASTNGVTFLQETVFIPLVLAVLIPLLAVATLSLAGRASGMKPKEVLEKRKAALEACPGNMNQLVLRI